jgi:PIN domain nuclease of toxin-antitoxin system
MRVLLDSHVFLWWVADDAELPSKLRRRLGAADSECWVSYASVWRVDRPVDPFVAEHCEANGFRLLPIGFNYVGIVEPLPWHHSEPLVAQALCGDVALSTHDASMRRHGVKVV